MKWGFTLRNNLKIAIVLFVVFAGLLVRHLIDKRHAAELGTRFASVYKDRLLVEGYIYELSNCLHQKKETIGRATPQRSVDVDEEMTHQDEKIRELVKAYEATKLTDKEAVVLTSLERRLEALEKTGNAWVNTLRYGHPADFDHKAQMETLIADASEDLHQLSAIQLAVGQDMNDQSQKILSESSMLSQFAVVMLIVLGLLVQVLIFSHEDRIKKVPNVRLN